LDPDDAKDPGKVSTLKIKCKEVPFKQNKSTIIYTQKGPTSTGQEDLRVLKLTFEPLGHDICSLLDTGPGNLFRLLGWPLQHWL
jgi:hypothetical protein